MTNDLRFIDNIKNSRLLGVEKDSDKRYNNSRSWNYNISRQGWRYHMSNIMAAIGIEQLKNLKNLLIEESRLLLLMINYFRQIKTWYASRDYKNVVPHIYVVRIKDLNDRDGLRKVFKEGLK